jgi:ubiquinone/menaquinone biosynthesis C-methylase UbiE
MSFEVAPDAYDRFMGRYSVPLAPQLADLAGILPGQRVLDVGCGPGALSTELARRLGTEAVSAVDPSTSFVAAARERLPGADIRLAAAEELPFEIGTFDAALAQLVVHFMNDPVAGFREMARVTREGGVVAASVWDYATGGAPLAVFWRAAHGIDPNVMDESELPGAREGHLSELLREAGMHDIEERALEVRVEHRTFEEWWEPYTFGVGYAGAFVDGLDDDERGRLRDRCRAALPPPPFVVTARAWAARGLV